MIDEDFKFEKQAEYADKLVDDLIKNGMPIQEIMNMPYNYLLQIMEDKHKPKESTSFFDLLG